MKYLVFLLMAAGCNRTAAQNTSLTAPGVSSPLAAYSAEWNKPLYARCNTAVKAIYMSGAERELIYILNLVRTYPALFANTVLARYPSISGNDYLLNDQYYYQSLVKELLAMKQAPLLYAERKCFESAACHAKASGKSGYTGHSRKSPECKAITYYSAECCDYGNAAPIDIILALLIDEDVPSLGHRRALLGSYTRVGASMQPHKTYRHNSVLDFSF